MPGQIRSPIGVATPSNGSAAAPAVRVGTDADTGLYYDATKGVVTTVNNVDRAMVKVDGTFETSSGVNNSVPAFVVTNTLGSAKTYVGQANPEGVLSATVGSRLVDVTNGRIYLKRTGSGASGWVQLDRCESGTYTPTATALTNLDSASGVTGYYQRVGDIVSGSAWITVDPTATGAATMRVSIPVASNFASISDAMGWCGTASVASSGSLIADTANDAFTVTFVALNTTSATVLLQFTYRVL